MGSGNASLNNNSKVTVLVRLAQDLQRNFMSTMKMIHNLKLKLFKQKILVVVVHLLESTGTHPVSEAKQGLASI